MGIRSVRRNLKFGFYLSYLTRLYFRPVYFVVDFIVDHLKAELDFKQEAENARRTAEFVASEPSLSDRVHIPKVSKFEH